MNYKIVFLLLIGITFIMTFNHCKKDKALEAPDVTDTIPAVDTMCHEGDTICQLIDSIKGMYIVNGTHYSGQINGGSDTSYSIGTNIELEVKRTSNRWIQILSDTLIYTYPQKYMYDTSAVQFYAYHDCCNICSYTKLYRGNDSIWFMYGCQSLNTYDYDLYTGIKIN